MQPSPAHGSKCSRSFRLSMQAGAKSAAAARMVSQSLGDIPGEKKPAGARYIAPGAGPATRSAPGRTAYLVGPAIGAAAGVSWWKTASQLPPRFAQTVEAKLSPKGWPANEPLPVQ